MKSSIALAAILALVTLSGCATLVQAPADVEAERLLPPGALVYARLDRAVLNAAMANDVAGIKKGDAQSARTIIDKTDMLTLALVRAPGSKQESLLAVAEGNYPQGSASFALATNSGWHRRGAIWERKDGAMYLAFVTGGRAIVGTVPIDMVVAAAAKPNAYPIPARWAGAWSEPVAIYAPNPMDLIASRVPLGDGAIPVMALVVSAHPIHGGPRDGAYDTTLQFQFDSDRAALVFSPICRIFLFAVAHALWPDSAATTVDEAIWRTDGPVVTARGMALLPTSIAALATGLSP